MKLPIPGKLQRWNAIALSIAGIISAGFAHAADETALRNLVTVYASGRLGSLMKDWCDSKAPASTAAHSAQLKRWRAALRLPEIEARLSAEQRARLDADVENKRTATYNMLEEANRDAAADCAQLEARLLAQADPRKVSPKEYAAAVAALSGAKSGAAETDRAAAPEPSAAPAINTKADPGVWTDGVLPAGAKIPTAVRPGQYLCTLEEPYYERAHRFELQLFADGGVSIWFVRDGETSLGDYNGRWQFDAKDGTFNAVLRFNTQFSLANDELHKTESVYFIDANGVPGMRSVNFGGLGQEHTCKFAGKGKLDASPLTAATTPKTGGEDAADELQPPSVKAPAPPKGAGGIEGLFSMYGSRYQTGFDASTGTYSGRYVAFQNHLYFMKNGYVYEGLYPASFDALDCARVKKDGKPLCDTYVIRGDTIQFGTEEPQPFKRYNDAGTAYLKIGQDNYALHAPLKDHKLEGTFVNVNFAATAPAGSAERTTFSSSRAISFAKNGRFEMRDAGGATYSSDQPGERTDIVTTSRDDSSGTYEIRGYTLTLRFGNGQVRRMVFLPGSEPHIIYLNGVFYKR